MIDDLKAREERRREAHWEPALRWKVLQETLTWAEAQSPARRNEPLRRVSEQAHKLAGIN